MSTPASTPAPPYYAVVFTSLRTPGDDGYAAAAERMIELAAEQPGFLGVESAREELGITVSYGRDLESIRAWKGNAEHLAPAPRPRRLVRVVQGQNCAIRARVRALALRGHVASAVRPRARKVARKRRTGGSSSS